MKDIGIIGSADGPTSIYVSSNDENFLRSGGIVPESIHEEPVDEVVQEEVIVNKDINDILNSRTLSENLDAGIKIMGIGMIAVFGVLTALYVVVKIMGIFAKTDKDKHNSNEKY